MGAGTPLLGTPVWYSRRPTGLDDQAWLPGQPSYLGDVCDGRQGGCCEADLGSAARTYEAVSWSSQRIKCAMLSSTESEYVAATEAGKEGRRLCFLLAEFRQLDAGTPTILRVDNKSAITVAEGIGLTGNLKHIERRQAWLQHMVKRGKFMMKYILTTEQQADFLTKALHYPAFNRCSVAIGQVRLADVGDGDNDVQ
ncbi:unnamed protein product [Closterium sp. NIES-53]